MCLTTAAAQTDRSLWSGEYCKCVVHTDLYFIQEYCGSKTAMEWHQNSNKNNNYQQCLAIWFMHIYVYVLCSMYSTKNYQVHAENTDIFLTHHNMKLNYIVVFLSNLYFHCTMLHKCTVWVTKKSAPEPLLHTINCMSNSQKSKMIYLKTFVNNKNCHINNFLALKDVRRSPTSTFIPDPQRN